VMTTGSRGLHLLIPLKQQKDFDNVRETAKKVAEFLEKKDKKSFTTATRKNKRDGKLFLDYLRNSFGQTAVVPYSLRAIEKAPIATPLDWQEVSNPQLHAQRYNLGNIFQRLGQKDQAWKNINHSRVILDEINKKFE
jgi:bifunctional non-homologous end joining protein LigD